jgi:hypothetical protein
MKKSNKKGVFVVETLGDANRVWLCFYDKKSAQNFKKFGLMYRKKSGAGNGYGAYWLENDTKITNEPEKIKNNWTFQLQKELIEGMNKHVNAVWEIMKAENETIIFDCKFSK